MAVDFRACPLPHVYLRSTARKLAGAIFILWKRQAIPLAFLLGASICFLAQPLTMKMWNHHMIPCLPFLCFVTVAPANWVAETVTGRLRRPAVAAGLTALASVLMILLATMRLRHETDYLESSHQRTGQIADVDRWVSQNVPHGSYLLESYWALGPDGIFRWIENVGVAVPNSVARRRDLKIWWLDRSDLEGKSGFVCISPADISTFRDDFERRRPGSTLNPFEDPRFHMVARFGPGPYEVQVFQFDLR